MGDATSEHYERHAGRLFGIAYRMLGSVSEAEDAVHDTFAAWVQTDQDAVRDPAAWLTTVTTRRCLDRLASARWQREAYVGSWLPEPLPTKDLDPSDVAGTADSLTLAFLVVLEALSPLERAVFVLHDVFGHPHRDIARMLDRSPESVRQVARRARDHLEHQRPRYSLDRACQHEVTQAFLAACAGEDLDTMLRLLAPDVTFTGDGGGKARSVRRPVQGAGAVARAMRGFWRAGRREDVTAELVEVNAAPGLRVVDPRGTIVVFAFDVDGDRITAIHGIRNPDKLAHLDGASRSVPRP